MKLGRATIRHPFWDATLQEWPEDTPLRLVWVFWGATGATSIEYCGPNFKALYFDGLKDIFSNWLGRIGLVPFGPSIR